jgi:hypothetical protein
MALVFYHLDFVDECILAFVHRISVTHIATEYHRDFQHYLAYMALSPWSSSRKRRGRGRK